jgi:hypothetical protein
LRHGQEGSHFVGSVQSHDIQQFSFTYKVHHSRRLQIPHPSYSGPGCPMREENLQTNRFGTELSRKRMNDGRRKGVSEHCVSRIRFLLCNFKMSTTRNSASAVPAFDMSTDISNHDRVLVLPGQCHNPEMPSLFFPAVT